MSSDIFELDEHGNKVKIATVVDNWDTRTALDCRLPELDPEFCQGCRDREFCLHHRQITIFDILNAKDKSS